MDEYRELPPDPDLAAARVAIADRSRLIEARLRAAMARGEQPTAAVLADALHACASWDVLFFEVLERAELLHARTIAAENRIAAMLDGEKSG
jgi:hypothetical protein